MKILRIFLIPFVLCVTQSSYAVVETDLLQKLESELYDFYAAHGVQERFMGVGDVEISTIRFEQEKAKAAVVISPGRTEPAIKYLELAYDLFQQGYSIYIIDHRGQGFSARMAKNHEIGYVKKFTDYIDDFEKFVDTIVKQHIKQSARPSIPLYLFAHSMGGGIAVGYLEKLQNAQPFSAVMLSSPMLKILTKPYPQPIALGIAETLSVVGLKKKAAPSRPGYEPWPEFDNNQVTHSRVRFEYTNRVFEHWPETRVGKPSNGWVKASMLGTKKIRKNILKTPNVPILIMSDDDDLLVDRKETEKLCAKLQKSKQNCTFELIPNTYHELVMEVDSVRNHILDKMLELFQ